LDDGVQHHFCQLINKNLVQQKKKLIHANFAMAENTIYEIKQMEVCIIRCHRFIEKLTRTEICRNKKQKQVVEKNLEFLDMHKTDPN